MEVVGCFWDGLEGVLDVLGDKLDESSDVIVGLDKPQGGHFTLVTPHSSFPRYVSSVYEM